MSSNEKLADQVLPKHGTSKKGEMRSNERLADQVLPEPDTSKIREYDVQQEVGRPGTPQTWHQ